MPVDKYIFPNCVPMFDLAYMRETIANKIPKNTYRVILYASGLTIAILEVVKYCIDNQISLITMHFDKVAQEWVEQRIC